MKRVVSLLLAALFITTLAPLSGRAQAPTGAPERTKPFRIYMITFRGITDVERGFKDYLAAQHVPVEYIMRDAKKDPKLVPPMVAEIKRLRPDLVYTYGTPVTLGIVGPYRKPNAKKYVSDIPVVFTLVASPVGAKIVPQLASSGRNVTGVSNVASTKQQMQAMASYRRFKKLGLIYAGNAKNSAVIVDEIRGLAKEMNFELIARTFNNDAKGEPTVVGVADIVADLKKAGAEWLYLPPDSFLGDALYEVVPAAEKAKLPTFGSTEQMMKGGALAGIICHYYSIGQLTAYKAQQILVQNKAPRDIPVETLKRFAFVITLPLARHLNMYPPIELFNYAEILTEAGKATKPKKSS